jgi:hypothetical protein
MNQNVNVPGAMRDQNVTRVSTNLVCVFITADSATEMSL